LSKELNHPEVQGIELMESRARNVAAATSIGRGILIGKNAEDVGRYLVDSL
jgi:hypothetical protein